MIASLDGTLTFIGKSEIILEVNGVGYFLNVSSKLTSSLGDLGSKLKLFTDLQVKDDKIVMYGFSNSRDQSIFKLLQTVQGVGPKAALSILSTLTIDELILAVSAADRAMISRAEGIGAKVASRITTELSDKVSDFHNSENSDLNLEGSQDKSQENFNLAKAYELKDPSAELNDIISALVNLGYSRSEVFSVVMKIKKDVTEKNINEKFTVSHIVPIALKRLSRGI